MSTNNWRISSFNGALLACYFIPTWALTAWQIVLSPIHGFYERPNVAVALFASDHLQLTGMAMVRLAWLLALGKLMAVAFFAVFLMLAIRAVVRKSGGGGEALAIALTIASVISFVSMVMASKVGETAALRLHATELLMLLGTAIVMVFEAPAQPQAESASVEGEALALHEPQLLDNR
jgi:hypothetical protein